MAQRPSSKNSNEADKKPAEPGRAGPVGGATVSTELGVDEDAISDASDTETASLVVAEPSNGERLDRVIAQHLRGFSRNYVQQRITGGDVRVDGVTLHKPAQRAIAGQTIEIELVALAEAQAFRPEAIPIDVMHEDDDLLVVRKPAGLVVHPAAGNWSGTLLNGLLARGPEYARLPRAGIVHRLDKDTSGLMVVAKTAASMKALIEAIAARRVGREYLALVHRSWAGAREVDVQAAIGRDPRNRLRMKAFAPGHAGLARPAWTRLECLVSGAGHTLLYCRLRTGRTHQIRVHAAHLGHPLVGDVLYGGRPEVGMARQALHAYRLALRHPRTGQVLHWTSQPPLDLAQAIAGAGLVYNDSQIRPSIDID